MQLLWTQSWTSVRVGKVHLLGFTPPTHFSWCFKTEQRDAWCAREAAGVSINDTGSWLLQGVQNPCSKNPAEGLAAREGAELGLWEQQRCVRFCCPLEAAENSRLELELGWLPERQDE